MFEPRKTGRPRPERPRRIADGYRLQVRMAPEERAQLHTWCEAAGMTSADAVRLALSRLVRQDPGRFRPKA